MPLFLNHQFGQVTNPFCQNLFCHVPKNDAKYLKLNFIIFHLFMSTRIYTNLVIRLHTVYISLFKLLFSWTESSFLNRWPKINSIDDEFTVDVHLFFFLLLFSCEIQQMRVCWTGGFFSDSDTNVFRQTAHCISHIYANTSPANPEPECTLFITLLCPYGTSLCVLIYI